MPESYKPIHEHPGETCQLEKLLGEMTDFSQDPLVNWRETKKAPETINAVVKDKTGQIIRSRTYAPYAGSQK